MAIQINIAGTDYVDSVERDSLKIDNILTSQIDTCKFILRKYGSNHTFIPKVGQEVTVVDGATKIFGGNIVKIEQRGDDYNLLQYSIDCNDYGRLLDRYLINDSFENKTIANIITLILVDKGLDITFTTTNVNAPKVISYIAFKYEPMSSVLTQLANLVNYDWYVDYDKDIHFFPKDQTNASFDIQDTDGSYIFNSLKIRKDNSQVKNVIYVRGGEYLGETFTTEIEATGVDAIYPIGYKYKDLSVTLTGEPRTVGLDYINPPENYDVLHNFQEKIIRFRDIDMPSAGAVIRIGGRPYLPVIVKKRNQDSIDAMASAEGGTGEYEYVIIDSSIDSREGARERASAELESYKSTLSEGEFMTYTSGLKAGQRIRINSDAHGIDDYFIINRVTYKPYTENSFVYQVSLVSTKSFGIIEFLRDLVEKDKKKIAINADEVLDLVEDFTENFTMSETTTASVSHNPQTETLTMGESFTAQSLNYAVQFVLGPYTWSGEGSGDTKRVMVLDAGELG